MFYLHYWNGSRWALVAACQSCPSGKHAADFIRVQFYLPRDAQIDLNKNMIAANGREYWFKVNQTRDMPIQGENPVHSVRPLPELDSQF